MAATPARAGAQAGAEAGAGVERAGVKISGSAVGKVRQEKRLPRQRGR